MHIPDRLNNMNSDKSLRSRALSLLASVSIALGALNGCAAPRAPLSEELAGLVGVVDKAYFVNRFGPPDKQAVIDSETEVWEYRLNEQRYTSATGYRFVTLDRLRVTFRRGKLAESTVTSVVE